ncbi:MAG TPA: hypothetical protein VN937_03330 [Blastocatellia bacterium]|nr:hypothetical protein [Blastocatellia bacterium]
MSISFGSVKAVFDDEVVQNGPNIPPVVHGSMRFSEPVIDAIVVLKGFHIEYPPGRSSAFFRHKVGIDDVKFKGHDVTFKVLCEFGDDQVLENDAHLGEDPFTATVFVLVIADIGSEADRQKQIRFRTSGVTLDAATTQEKVQSGFVQFVRPVVWAEAMIQRFRIEYAENDDEDFFIERVGIQNVTHKDNVVNFETYLTLLDGPSYDPGSNAQDEIPLRKSYKGSVQVAVIASLK